MVTQFEGFIAQANFGPLSVFADCTQQQIDRAKKDRSVIRYSAKTKIENSMDQKYFKETAFLKFKSGDRIESIIKIK